MRNVGRKLAFVLASSNHGTMIVNRLDYRMSGPDKGIGVGYQLLEAATFDPVEVELALQLIEARKRVHGDGVVAIDGGANIGVHTIEWATAMTGWGSVIAIEAQERIYYALAGNIAINNCFNAIAMHAAISSEQGIMLIPTPDYLVPSSFGSLESRAPKSNSLASRSTIRKATRSRYRRCRSTHSVCPAWISSSSTSREWSSRRWKAPAGRSSAAIQFFWLNLSKRAASVCVVSSTNADTKSSKPALTCSRSTRATRSSTSSKSPICRRNRQRPELLIPSLRQARSGPADSRQQQAPA